MAEEQMKAQEREEQIREMAQKFKALPEKCQERVLMMMDIYRFVLEKGVSA